MVVSAPIKIFEAPLYDNQTPGEPVFKNGVPLPSPILIAQTAHLQLAIVFNLLKLLILPVVVAMMFLTSALSVVMAV